jgi:signal transduction histidine kinase
MHAVGTQTMRALPTTDGAVPRRRNAAALMAALDRIAAAPVIAAGAVACGVTVYVTVTGTTSTFAWLNAGGRVVTIAVPLAVGLYAHRRPPFVRFGTLLVMAAFGLFVTTLASADSALVYSIARVAQWPVEVGIVFLLLAFPEGRLRSRGDRRVVLAGALLVAIVYLPTTVVIQRFSVPAPLATCGSTCPSNAFMLPAHEPAIVDDVIRPLRDGLTALVFAAATARLALRTRAGSELTRTTLAPVTLAATFRLGVYTSAVVVRRAAPGSPVVGVAAWLVALGLAVIALAFLVGLVRWRLFIAAAMERLAARLKAHPGPEDLRPALAAAFRDPSLEIAYWLDEGGGRWTDHAGHAVDPPTAASGRCLTTVLDGDRPVAAIVHDGALRDDRAFVDAATSYALMTLDNQRLSAQTASLLRESRETRRRVRTAADDERRRIERDLHDGAQQRLVALRIKLELAAETAGADGAAAELRALGAEVDETIDELRDMAHGLYPLVLAQAGVGTALRDLARRSAIPAAVDDAIGARHPEALETAVYFCCLEAVQNAAKHAGAGASVTIHLEDDARAVRFRVEDDGVGFDVASAERGAGLGNIADRVGALGGTLRIFTSPGAGTRVLGEIPV